MSCFFTEHKNLFSQKFIFNFEQFKLFITKFIFLLLPLPEIINPKSCFLTVRFLSAVRAVFHTDMTVPVRIIYIRNHCTAPNTIFYIIHNWSPLSSEPDSFRYSFRYTVRTFFEFLRSGQTSIGSVRNMQF